MIYISRKSQGGLEEKKPLSLTLRFDRRSADPVLPTAFYIWEILVAPTGRCPLSVSANIVISDSSLQVFQIQISNFGQNQVFYD
jgi:hypothetical protein